MSLPHEPWQVDITDFKFTAYGETWCLSIEYESADDGYTPLLSLRAGLARQLPQSHLSRADTPIARSWFGKGGACAASASQGDAWRIR